MQRKSISLGSKLMAGCALVVACVLATPAAMAHGRHGNNNTADVVGALVVGAVIGGVLVSASQHHDNYRQDRYYYPPQAYAPVGYNNYYNSYPAYQSYPYGGGVSVGVVYSNGGHYYRGYGRTDHRYDRRWNNRGQHYYRGSHRH